jgi:hypothetical protein
MNNLLLCPFHSSTVLWANTVQLVEAVQEILGQDVQLASPLPRQPPARHVEVCVQIATKLSIIKVTDHDVWDLSIPGSKKGLQPLWGCRRCQPAPEGNSHKVEILQ